MDSQEDDMPVTNEILPFAPQATVALSEILSLAEYTADSQRLRGNQPGIARLELVNTVLKQTSHMTAGLAQFIANRYDGGVKDDGNLDAVESGLQAAIMSLVSGVTDPLSKTLATLEAIRKSWIGAPRYHRSTVLPPDYAWVNGDLILFEDRPEFEEVYLAGGFEGMLLEANATSEQIAANLGKFRKHPNGLGLYLPSCGEQFFRAWTLGAGREAGSWQQDAVETGITSVYCEPMGGYGDSYPATITLEGNVYLHDTDYADSIIVYMADIGTPVAHRRYYINQRQAQETRPANIAQPSIIYLGIPA